MKTYKLPKTIKINRRRWLNGSVISSGRTNQSMLCNTDNQMCCLGFACRQAGIPKNEILQEADPKSLFFNKDITTNMVTKDGQNKIWIEKAIEINDDLDISDPLREKKLQSLFKKHGKTIEFTG